MQKSGTPQFYIKNTIFAWSRRPNSQCEKSFCTPYNPRYTVGILEYVILSIFRLGFT